MTSFQNNKINIFSERFQLPHYVIINVSLNENDTILIASYNENLIHQAFKHNQNLFKIILKYENSLGTLLPFLVLPQTISRSISFRRSVLTEQFLVDNKETFIISDLYKLNYTEQYFEHNFKCTTCRFGKNWILKQYMHSSNVCVVKLNTCFRFDTPKTRHLIKQNNQIQTTGNNFSKPKFLLKKMKPIKKFETNCDCNNCLKSYVSNDEINYLKQKLLTKVNDRYLVFRLRNWYCDYYFLELIGSYSNLNIYSKWIDNCSASQPGFVNNHVIFHRNIFRTRWDNNEANIKYINTKQALINN
jgi:hypothetical protein